MKFRVYQSYWGMTALPYGGEEWSMEEKLAKIAEAGFDGVEFLMEDKAHREAMNTFFISPTTRRTKMTLSNCKCLIMKQNVLYEDAR